jgi:hypothetical protein
MSTNFQESSIPTKIGSVLSRWPLFALIAIGLTPLMPAYAAGTVGTGTPESCTEAALDAALAGGGLVRFDCGPPPHTITVTATKTITTDTIVDGGGLVALDGAHQGRLFQFEAGTTSALRHLVIMNGGNSDSAVNSVSNDGNLAITDCVFTGNIGWNGGAISNAGTLAISDSTFEENQTDISGFLLMPPDSIANGGALYNAGSLRIVNSTFSKNAALRGGAIFHVGATLTITNTTLAGNVAGHGAAVWTSGQPAMIINATIVNNASTFDMGSAIGALGNMTIRNTLIANNLGVGGNCNFSGPLIDAGHNLQYPGTSCGATIPVADPLLAPLAFNGGVTQTMALLPGSPAIDAGDPATCPATDQRGWPRVDGDDIGGAVCDIGAHEFTPAVPPARNVTGLWWNPEASGMSISLHQNAAGVTFGVWYTYDIDHGDMWLTLQGDWVSPGTFAGTLRRTTGPAIGDPSDPTQVSLFPVGTGILSFTDADHGTFSYALGGVAESEPIRRFEF